jgi:hypothetical protein
LVVGKEKPVIQIRWYFVSTVYEYNEKNFFE